MQGVCSRAAFEEAYGGFGVSELFAVLEEVEAVRVRCGKEAELPEAARSWLEEQG